MYLGGIVKHSVLESRGVPRGDAQDARASPSPPLCIPPSPRASPPPQPERLVMRKDEAVGNKKKIIKIFLKSITFFSVQFQFYF
jgi:hypothetical protein